MNTSLTTLEIKQISKLFGVNFKVTKKAKQAALSQVYFLDTKYILRSLKHERNLQAKLEKDRKIFNKIEKLTELQLPELRMANSKKFFVLKYNYAWTLYPAIRGNVPYTWDNLHMMPENIVKRILKTEKEIHLKTRGIFSKKDSGRKQFINDFQKKFEKKKNLISTLGRTRTKQAIKNLFINIQRTDPTKLCFVHGDFHPGNLVFDSKYYPKGIFDLDWYRIGYGVEDFAYTAMMLLRNYSSNQYKHRAKKLKKLIDWYGVKREDRKIFNDYLIIYTTYDIFIFDDIKELKRKSFLSKYQKSMLDSLSKRV